MGDYGRILTRLRRQGKDNSHEEYKVVLESYMRHSCALMCERYGSEARSSLVEMKGILMLFKVIPSVLLHELYMEVLSACTEEPVAISQSSSQVFMHEIPGNVIGQVGVGVDVGGGNVCKLLNIFLQDGVGVLWPRHRFCKVMLLQTDSIPVEEWKDCTYHLDFAEDTLEKISRSMPSLRPVFMIVPLEEGGAKLDVGYHGRRLPKASGKIRTKTIRKGSVLVVSSFQWHRTSRPDAMVENSPRHIGKGVKRMRKPSFVCASHLRLHICIGPEAEYVNPHEATVAGEEKNM